MIKTNCNVILDAKNEPQLIDDYRTIWIDIFQQKITFACFRDDTDEIVGINVAVILCKDDNFLEQSKNIVS